MPSKELLRQHLLAAAERRQMQPFTEAFQAMAYALEVSAESGTNTYQDAILERLENLMVEVSHFFDGYKDMTFEKRGED